MKKNAKTIQKCDHNRKYQQNQANKSTTLIYGIHSAITALANPKRSIIEIYCTNEILHKYKEIISSFKYQITDNQQLNILTNHGTHQGIAVKTSMLTIYGVESLNLDSENCKIVILDQITDSHNIGAIIRSAAAFNIKAIISTQNNSPEENPIINKTAAGGMEVVDFVKVVNLQSTINYLKKHGFWIIGLDIDSTHKISPEILSGKIAVVLGSEGSGMRSLTKKNCDIIIKLPMSPNMESLNVSNAAAITFYELYNSQK